VIATSNPNCSPMAKAISATCSTGVRLEILAAGGRQHISQDLRVRGAISEQIQQRDGLLPYIGLVYAVDKLALKCRVKHPLTDVTWVSDLHRAVSVLSTTKIAVQMRPRKSWHKAALAEIARIRLSPIPASVRERSAKGLAARESRAKL
jgi:hypothetical protein